MAKMSKRETELNEQDSLQDITRQMIMYTH